MIPRMRGRHFIKRFLGTDSFELMVSLRNNFFKGFLYLLFCFNSQVLANIVNGTCCQWMFLKNHKYLVFICLLLLPYPSIMFDLSFTSMRTTSEIDLSCYPVNFWVVDFEPGFSHNQ